MPVQGAIPIGMIVFKIEEREFCFDIRLLVRILKPGEPDFNRPIDEGHSERVVFDGQDYFLIDIGSFCETKDQTHGDASWILLIEYRKRKLAFQVEAVTQIITGLGSKDSPFRFISTKDMPNCLGYFEAETRKVWEIDFESVIRSSLGLRRAV